MTRGPLSLQMKAEAPGLIPDPAEPSAVHNGGAGAGAISLTGADCHSTVVLRGSPVVRVRSARRLGRDRRGLLPVSIAFWLDQIAVLAADGLGTGDACAEQIPAWV